MGGAEKVLLFLPQQSVDITPGGRTDLIKVAARGSVRDLCKELITYQW